MSQNVYIALPAYDGTTRVETTMSLLHEASDLMAAGINFKLNVNAGDSILPRARNMFLGDFVRRKEFTDVLFLDHDICWPKGMIRKLLSYPVDFVAGVYPKRSDPVDFAVRLLQDRELLVADPEHGLLEVEGVPFGFVRMSRRGVEQMYAKYWGLAYKERNLPEDFTPLALFDFQLCEGEYWGEDFVFCKRWREMGGKVWVDPDIRFQHIGYKRFEATMSEWLHDRQTPEQKDRVRVVAGRGSAA